MVNKYVNKHGVTKLDISMDNEFVSSFVPVGCYQFLRFY